MTIRVVEHEGGWLQVDIRVRLPDGTRYRERLKAPVQSRSAARRWAEERERYLALNGPKQPKKEVPTLEDFESRFISEHVEANQLKPSTAASYKSRLKNHIRPNLGRLRLDEIDKQAEQRLKAAMKQFDPGTINDTLAVLSRLLNCAAEWGVIGSAPRFAKLKTRPTEIEFFDFDDFERLGGWRSQGGPCRARVRVARWRGGASARRDHRARSDRRRLQARPAHHRPLRLVRPDSARPREARRDGSR